MNATASEEKILTDVQQRILQSMWKSVDSHIIMCYMQRAGFMDMQKMR